jgi:hypothetical protein
MSWTHGYYGGIRMNPSKMDSYDQVKEEVISDVWEFSIAQAQDYASTPELRKSLQELVYSISESIIHNDKISKMYQDSKGKGAINAE